MAKVFNIYRQEGFILNPNDKIVNGILKGLDRCKGKCPCCHDTNIPEEDLLCPCKEYRENKHCRCNLYIKAPNYEEQIALLEIENNNLKSALNTNFKQEELVY